MQNLDFDSMTTEKINNVMNLEKDEQELVDSIENDDWASIPNSKLEIQGFQDIAKHQVSMQKTLTIKKLLDLTNRTNNTILYGVPGTGKTWNVQKFATYFLLKENISSESANKYWEAVQNNDYFQIQELQDKVCTNQILNDS